MINITRKQQMPKTNINQVKTHHNKSIGQYNMPALTQWTGYSLCP